MNRHRSADLFGIAVVAVIFGALAILSQGYQARFCFLGAILATAQLASCIAFPTYHRQIIAIRGRLFSRK